MTRPACRPIRRREVCAFLAAAAGAGGLEAAARAATAAGGAFRDPLATPLAPPEPAERAAGQPLLAVAASAGGALLAVGLRGLVLRGDATGSWRAATVPVQTDLVAVQAQDARRAWACGHDAVILKSDDGGAVWQKVFDREGGQAQLGGYYRERISAGDASLQRFADQIKLNTEGTVSLPYLGVHFDDATTGWAVGAFGMLIATRDGGRSWQPWLDRIENDEFLNLNNVRGIDGEVYIAAERGMVFRLDRSRQRFVAASTGYKGSFFDIVGSGRALVAFGLRGAAWRSTDRGESWHPVATGTERSITAGVALDDGRRIVLFTEAGGALQSTDDGASFAPLAIPKLMPAFGAAAAGPGRLLTAGWLGVQLHALPPVAG